MHRFLFTLTMLWALPVSAQQTAASALAGGSNWQHVQALPVGTSVYVNAGNKTVRCTLTSVDSDTLTCAHGKAIVYQRTEITSVKLSHRGRSTLIMAGVGAGVGAGVVKAVAVTIFGNSFTHGTAKGAVYVGGAGMGAIIFWPIGFLGDPARSTVYKAP